MDGAVGCLYRNGWKRSFLSQDVRSATTWKLHAHQLCAQALPR
jgi:hypothetical protein